MMKVKIIVGFRRDQEYSIRVEEAHKAYYLFLNPDKRGVFSNGLAITGSQIKEIVPDYQGTMGWNPTHILDSDDWNEIRAKGIDRKFLELLKVAKDAAYVGYGINEPLSKLVNEQRYYLLDKKL